jgi:Protein of unknown function (DUF3137)
MIKHARVIEQKHTNILVPQSLDYTTLRNSRVRASAIKETIDRQPEIIVIDIVIIFAVIATAYLNESDRGMYLLETSAVLGFIAASICHIYISKVIYYEYIIDQFARANQGVTAIFDRFTGRLKGSMFRVGHSKTVTVGLEHKNAGWAIGNYEYAIGHGKSEQYFRCGFIALQLSKRLPNILIESKQSRGILDDSSIPVILERTQLNILEGDFANHFNVYAPSGHESDVRYILTPELMAQLVDYGRDFHFEIIDNMLYIYSKEFRFKLRSIRKTLTQVLPLANLFQREFIDNTMKYFDTHTTIDKEVFAPEDTISLHSNMNQKTRKLTTRARIFRLSRFTLIVIIVTAILGGITSYIDTTLTGN